MCFESLKKRIVRTQTNVGGNKELIHKTGSYEKCLNVTNAAFDWPYLYVISNISPAL